MAKRFFKTVKQIELEGILGNRAKHQAPSTKHQAPEKHQDPNIKLPAVRIGSWNLELLWSLELDVWCFRQSSKSGKSGSPQVGFIDRLW
jgi:hypothetical protein